MIDYIAIFVLMVYGLINCKICSIFRKEIHSYQIGLLLFIESLTLLIRISDFSISMLIIFIPVSLFLIIDDYGNFKNLIIKYKTVFFSFKSL